MNKVIELIFNKILTGDITKEVGKDIIECIQREKIDNDIAIIGMALRVPKAKNKEEFFNNILHKRDCITDYPLNRHEDSNRLVKHYTNINPEEIEYCMGGYLEEIDTFDCRFFKILPEEARYMDPSQKLFLEVAMEALEDAGYGGNKLHSTKTGVYLGYNNWPMYGQYILKQQREKSTEIITGNVPSIIASRIAYILNLSGPAMLIDTACSSSMVALHKACQGILSNECEQALVGGVKLNLMPVKGAQDIGQEAKDNRIRTFDKDASGIVWGEGVVALLLKPLKQAITSRDNIYAVIKGSTINQDGHSLGLMAPSVMAQKNLIRDAWQQAGVKADDIAYIELHGTGTPIGDVIEAEGLNKAFSEYTNRKQFCAVGSVKTNIGHLDNASGCVGVVKTALAIKNNIIPPSIHLNQVNPKIRMHNMPIYYNKEGIAFTEGKRKICGVSSFGISGTNAHVILQDWNGQNVQQSDKRLRIITLSSKKKDLLGRMISQYNQYLNKSQADIRDICYTSCVGREHYDYRIALIVSHMDQLRQTMLSIQEMNFNFLQQTHIFYGYHKIVADEYDNPSNGNISKSNYRKMCREAKQLVEEYLKSPKEVILRKLAKLYVHGADINWDLVYSQENCWRVSIPTYEYDKVRYWYEG